MKRKLMLAALAMFETLNIAHAGTPFEIRRVQLTQRSVLTDLQVEFVVRYFTRQPIMFVRLRCEVFDAKNTSLGIHMKDFSSGVPYRPLNLPTGSFQRPVMYLEYIAGADHASCRFATVDDPVPIVRPDEVVAELDSMREVHITNHSHFQIASVGFECRGPKLTTSYNQSGLGWSPGYTSPRNVLQYEAEECTVTRVTVSPVQNLEGMLSNQ